MGDQQVNFTRVVAESLLSGVSNNDSAARAVNKALIGGGCIFIHSRSLDEFLLKSTVMTTDFKRNSTGRTRMHEYAQTPLINALVTALNASSNNNTSVP